MLWITIVWHGAVYKGSVIVERLVADSRGSGQSETMELELKAGSFFGESALLSDGKRKRNASIRAAELCHLFVLHEGDFRAVLHDFPEYMHVLKVCVFQALRQLSEFALWLAPLALKFPDSKRHGAPPSRCDALWRRRISKLVETKSR